VSAKEYNKLVKGTTTYRGAYPLVVPMKVGDYFELNKADVMVHLGNVFNWPGWSTAIKVDTDEIANSQTQYAGCSREGSVTAGAGVKAPIGVGVDATVSLSFSKSSGFALAYETAKRSQVRDVPTVQRHIRDLAKAGHWEERWVFITEVIEASSATLVVTTQKSSRISLHANADLPPGLDQIAIANPELGWTASSWSGSGYSSLCKPGTPLYRCIKVKKTIFGRIHTELLGDEHLDAAFTDDPFDEADG
jgi:hypothetical protein